jgi:predicted aspartyl protease
MRYGFNGAKEAHVPLPCMKTLLALLSVCLLAACMMPYGPPMGPMNGGGGAGGLAQVVVPMRLMGETPHVMASINGRQPLPLLLDTGATYSIVTPDVATGLDLQPTGGSRVTVRGVHGTTGATQAVMSTMQVGEWRATDVACLVRGMPGSSSNALGHAILGMNHMRYYCSFLTIDYRRNTVELGFSRPYQPLSPAATRTPLRWSNGLPMIRVSSGGISWDAIVDTGSCWGIVIDQDTAARLGHAYDGQRMGDDVILSGVGGSVGAGQAGARVLQLSNAYLCGEPRNENTTAYVMPGPKRVGSLYWQGTRLTVDFRSNVLWLER